MKSSDSMNCIHKKKFNNISECNLPNEIPNPSKRTKNTNTNYSPFRNGFIIHVRVKQNLMVFEYPLIVDVVPRL